MTDRSVEDAEFLFLGTGTSSGVPIIGCSCEVCVSDDPRDRRTRCGGCLRFLERGPNGAASPRAILFDTPPDHREQSLRHRLDRCDAIVYTHPHVDHTFGLDDVRRYNAIMGRPIDLYADDSTLDHLRRVYRHIFDRKANVNDSFVADLVPRAIDAERPFEVGSLRFSPLRLLHGRLPVLGFRIDGPDEAPSNLLPLAYCTDVNGIPPETWPKLAGLRTLVLGMLRYRSHPTHFTVDEAIAAADRIGAERTYFIHMTHDIRHADLDPRLPAGMSLAYDGLVIR